MQRLLIHLQAFELLNRQPIRDPSLFLKIQAWNGSSWNGSSWNGSSWNGSSWN